MRVTAEFGTRELSGTVPISADLSRFTKMMARMLGTSGDGVHDRLTDFTCPVSGAFYFAPSLDDLDGILPSD